MNATTVAVDLAKDSFEVVMASSSGHIIGRRRCTRAPFEQCVRDCAPGTTLVMEACGTAHHWARYAQQHGLVPRLRPPQ